MTNNRLEEMPPLQTLYAMFEEWRVSFPPEYRPERDAPNTKQLEDAWIAGFAKHNEITCAAQSLITTPVEPLFTEGNRTEAIRLLRELRETNDPDEIQRQKESWAQLESALNLPVAADAQDEGHHLPNYLWCKRCQAWIETEHVCGARYLDKGDYFELIEPAAPPVTCLWTYDPDGYWQTACNDQFCITEGLPSENRMYYCPYCGRRIVISVDAGVIDAINQPGEKS